MNPSVNKGITAKTIPSVWVLMCYVFIIVAPIGLATPDASAKDKGLYKVKGKVTDMITGKKIKGATVTLTGDSGTATVTTNKKGKYKFKVPPGQLKMEISFPDYVSQSKDIYVIDTKVVADVALRPNYSVGNPYETAVENGFTGTEDQWLSDMLGVGPEICSYCHNGGVARNGESHQAEYDELFQEGVIQVSGVTYSNNGTDDTVTFKMTMNGDDLDCTAVDSLNIRFTQYVAATDTKTARFIGDGSGGRLSLKGTVTYDAGTNTCTSVNPQTVLGNLSTVPGFIVVYGEDGQTDSIGHITLAKYPFAAMPYYTGGFIPGEYESEANVTGCENCHQTPYYKHGYIRGDISDGGGLDFYACKVCHISDADGHHQSWKLSVDQPQVWGPLFLAAQEAAAAGDTNNDSVEDHMTKDQLDQYAYKTRLMNDVHMSHSMEFPYPQPIRTCATCHEGKLDEVLSDKNFILETCLSCHPVTGGTDTADSNGNFAVDTRPMALKTIWENAGVSLFHFEDDGSVITSNDPDADCNDCHNASGVASNAVFSRLHTGYDPLIYYKDGDGNYLHYRDAITASIDSVTLDNNVLDIKFSAAGTAGELSADDIVPTVQVSFYGYDTKDFILSNHTRNANGDRMEKTMGEDNPLFTEVTNEPGNWEVTMDMAAYAAGPEDQDIVADIANGVIKKAEVIVRPSLDHPTITTVDHSGNVIPAPVGLNAVSKTVDVTLDGTDQFVANYFQGVDPPGTNAGDKVGNALVKVDKVVDPDTGRKSGCNSCHDQLAITFHTGDRGGNIVVCRSCHVVTSGGSHLEGQSRSIDSYVHAIHRFQAFDVDNIDFSDPVEKAKYEEETEFLFPDFAAINCERCHTDSRVVDNEMRGTFDIPDQSKSMPGLLSATDELPGFNLNATPEVVVGPAARACGGCHRAQFIKEDDPGGYAMFNEHTKVFGYRVENDDNDYILYATISYIMGLFQ